MTKTHVVNNSTPEIIAVPPAELELIAGQTHRLSGVLAEKPEIHAMAAARISAEISPTIFARFAARSLGDPGGLQISWWSLT